MRDTLRAMRTQDYQFLTAKQKLVLTAAVADSLLSLDSVHAVISDNENKQRDLHKERREAEASMKKELAAVGIKAVANGAADAVEPAPAPAD
eukprot:6211241-Pleurochrysis_carterae.AAC.5